MAVAVGAHHEVEHARLVQQPRAQVLRHAAGHADHDLGARGLDPRELAEPAEHAQLGVLADRAGVEQDRIGVICARDQRHAGALQHAGHGLCVGHIHLAAVGLEEHALHEAATIARVGRAGRSPSVAVRSGRSRPSRDGAAHRPHLPRGRRGQASCSRARRPAISRSAIQRFDGAPGHVPGRGRATPGSAAPCDEVRYCGIGDRGIVRRGIGLGDPDRVEHDAGRVGAARARRGAHGPRIADDDLERVVLGGGALRPGKRIRPTNN